MPDIIRKSTHGRYQTTGSIKSSHFFYKVQNITVLLPDIIILFQFVQRHPSVFFLRFNFQLTRNTAPNKALIVRILLPSLLLSLRFRKDTLILPILPSKIKHNRLEGSLYSPHTTFFPQHFLYFFPDPQGQGSFG